MNADSTNSFPSDILATKYDVTCPTGYILVDILGEAGGCLRIFGNLAVIFTDKG